MKNVKLKIKLECCMYITYWYLNFRFKERGSSRGQQFLKMYEKQVITLPLPHPKYIFIYEVLL